MMRTAKLALIACLLGGCNDKTDSLAADRHLVARGVGNCGAHRDIRDQSGGGRVGDRHQSEHPERSASICRRESAARSQFTSTPSVATER
jgi:hypothetical protein